METGPVMPYGVPIRDAIARGDVNEMRSLLDAVAPAVKELKAAVKKAEKPRHGSRMPYGPPIRDAVARGDLKEMKALRDSVKPAVKKLEKAIRKLEGKKK